MENTGGISIITENTAMRMIDWHTHILPSMDDGSKNVEESADMLKRSFDAGVMSVVLTPHFYPHREHPESFLKRRSRSMQKLNTHLKEIENETVAPTSLPALIPGAEVYFFHELAAMEEGWIKELCIGKSKYLMIELPLAPWSDEIYRTIEVLMFDRKIIPVIAHIDRYFHLTKDISRLKELVREGMLIQMNVEALSSFFSRRKAFKWLDAGLVHILASDCHDLSKRPPNMDCVYELLKARIDDRTIEELTTLDPMQ